MKFVHAPEGVFQQIIQFGQVVEFSSTCKTTARQLTPEQKVQYGVSKLQLVTPPPYNPDTQVRVEADPVLIDGVWMQVWAVTSSIPTDPDALEAFKATYASKRKADLAAIRYAKETAGITFNGMPVSTDRASQAMLTGAHTTVQVTPEIIIDWKGNAGWVQLNKAAIEALSQAVSSHIQSCFSNEKTVSTLIDAATTVAELEAIDLNAGWPV